jgi:hypothetical protein
VAIDTTGEWWKGSEAADLVEYLKAATVEAYPVDEIRAVHCHCGCDTFQLEVDPLEGAARRTCTSCDSARMVCDSADSWEEAEPEEFECVGCRSRQANVYVGFSLYPEEDAIRWLYIGVRCNGCGILGVFGDWKIGYGPSLHLLDQV